MRAILAAAILLLCLSNAETEPEYSPALPGSSHLGGENLFVSLAEIESARVRAKRKPVATPSTAKRGAQQTTTKTQAPPAPTMAEGGGQNPAARPQALAAPAAADAGEPTPATPFKPEASEQQAAVEPAPARPSKAEADGQQQTISPQAPAMTPANSDSALAPLPSPKEASTAPQVPLDDLCNALLTSAQHNDLPVPFFANLIWQESRLRDNAVSPKGALGIAQFMPKVAVASGLENPFDPRQALSASARLLRELRDQFGNLGFVAAAYNAGAKRVSEWLQRGRTLPRETRGYVMDVTGHSVEQWKETPVDDADLHFVHRLPCRDKPAFAELEQAQLQQTQSDHAQVQQAQNQKPQPPKPSAPKKVLAKAEPRRERLSEGRHPRLPLRREKARTAERELHRPRYEAKDEHVRRAALKRHGRA
jgi:soluble lytic murein transglycosylase-like protein